MDRARKTTFALFFGNRGFFPPSLQGSARREMKHELEKLGHEVIMAPAKATRYGAVETAAEGRCYAEFLRKNRGRYGGVILCLPNFGDENGASEALQDAGVPIFIQAYPDEMEKMAPEVRRDAFCGKFSIMDVFCQKGIKFSVLNPHVVHPATARFAANIDHFDRVCRVTGGMKRMVVGTVGARTTAFKTVRIDELALESHGITMETMDLSSVIARMEKMKASDPDLRRKKKVLQAYSCWRGVPGRAFERLSRLGVVLDRLVREFGMDCVAVRCWVEMQEVLGISPCVLMSEMNNRGVPAACEVDAGNAVAMYALSLASGGPAACLDWNNNYGSDDGKCILFHCGPVPQSMMTGQGRIADHAILANAVGKGCAWGCNTGRIAPGDFTFSSLQTLEGKLKFFLGQGSFTADPIPDEYFGCAGVAEIPNLQDVLRTIGLAGFRHHVSVTPQWVREPVREAFERYLGYDVTAF